VKRKAWWFVLILLIGIPTGLTLNAFHRDQASRNLIQAIKHKNVPAALAALRNGADPNARDYSRDKPLSFGERTKLLLAHLLHLTAIPTPDTHPTALQLLLDSIYESWTTQGWSVHIEMDSNGRPSRTRSMENDKHVDLTLLKTLLDVGADPNLANEDRMFPLEEVACWGHPQGCHLLLLHGANVHKKDTQGCTALHWAAKNGMNTTIDSLLAAGADVEAKNELGQTPLHMACLDPNNSAVQALLHHHANVKARDSEGDTPLHSAVQYGDPELIDILLADGADIDARNKSGWTPLHLASSYRNIDTVRALLRHHADLYARTSDGKTALETTQNVDTIQVLRHAGGKTGAGHGRR
jgi:ankyrin repeat protein